MSSGQILEWTLYGTLGNAVAMALAALFAGLAWFSQVRYARGQRESAVRETAVAHAAAAIADLTKGDVSEARRRVADWSTRFANTSPSRRNASNDAIRGDTLTGEHANTGLRDDVFVLLWSLQRLAPLSEDVKHAQRSQCRVLALHIGLIASSLGQFSSLLEGDELELFRESADASTEAIVALGNAMDVDLHVQLAWSVPLAGFTLEVIGSDQ